jgi:hypothetical protein
MRHKERHLRGDDERDKREHDQQNGEGEGIALQDREESGGEQRGGGKGGKDQHGESSYAQIGDTARQSGGPGLPERRGQKEGRG